MTAGREELDLRDPAVTGRWLEARRPAIAFVARATIGGIVANENNPAMLLDDSLAIEAAVIHQAHVASVRRLVFLDSSWAFPRLAPQPIPEDALLTAS